MQTFAIKMCSRQWRLGYTGPIALQLAMLNYIGSILRQHYSESDVGQDGDIPVTYTYAWDLTSNPGVQYDTLLWHSLNLDNGHDCIRSCHNHLQKLLIFCHPQRIIGRARGQELNLVESG